MNKNLTLQDSIFLACGFALLIWSVKLGEELLGISLSHLGVYPQTPGGLIGVVTAPLIHGSLEHVLSNTLPVMLLGSMLIYGYPKSRWWVLGIVWIVSGFGVWFFARTSFHIGASGINHGMFFFLVIAGILRGDNRSSALLMVAFFMYGTMFWTIFPYKQGVSFEYHLFGAVGGVACAILFHRWDPKPVRKTYSWEQEEKDYEEDPIIGDQWMIKPKSTDLSTTYTDITGLHSMETGPADTTSADTSNADTSNADTSNADTSNADTSNTAIKSSEEKPLAPGAVNQKLH
jgi:membrane associated rhomboid family serine protease